MNVETVNQLRDAHPDAFSIPIPELIRIDHIRVSKWTTDQVIGARIEAVHVAFEQERSRFLRATEHFDSLGSFQTISYAEIVKDRQYRESEIIESIQRACFCCDDANEVVEAQEQWTNDELSRLEEQNQLVDECTAKMQEAGIARDSPANVRPDVVKLRDSREKYRNALKSVPEQKQRFELTKAVLIDYLRRYSNELRKPAAVPKFRDAGSECEFPIDGCELLNETNQLL